MTSKSANAVFLAKFKYLGPKKNPGRRFLGCGRYDRFTKHCDFFCWFDPPGSKFTMKTINELLAKNENLVKEVKVLNEEIVRLNQLVEVEHEEKEFIAGQVESYKGEARKLKMFLICIVIVLLCMLLHVS